MRFFKVMRLTFFMSSAVSFAYSKVVDLGHSTGRSGVLLEMKTSRGYTPVEMCGSEGGIIVENSGKVKSFSKENTAAPREYRDLGPLSANVFMVSL